MKRGKSTWAYRLAVSVAHGAEFMTRETLKGAVLILAVEEHERDVKARLKRFGMTKADPIYIHADKLHNTPEVLQDVREFIVKHKIILVIIDSLSRFWGVQNENDNMEVVREVSPLLDMAHETDAAIMPVHHERKGGGEDGLSIRGGSSLFGLADQAIFLERQPGQRTNKRVLKTLGRYDSPPELD
jgi:RecA-family ATPase